jgi:hypothetical protein
MTDTTPVVGDVWESDNESRTVLGVTIDKVRYMLTTYEEVCSLDEWHAWAANARKVT